MDALGATLALALGEATPPGLQNIALALLLAPPLQPSLTLEAFNEVSSNPDIYIAIACLSLKEGVLCMQFSLPKATSLGGRHEPVTDRKGQGH